MKYLIIALFISTCTGFADDLNISNAMIRFKESTEVDVYIYKTKKYEKQIRYSYNVSFLINNISKSTISVVTSSFGKSVIPYEDQPKEISVSHDKMQFGDNLVIPSVTDLKIVSIRPNESANVGFEFRSSKKIDIANIVYSMEDYYDNRFEYWTGKIKSDIVNVRKH